jgi:hypothetical protein
VNQEKTKYMLMTRSPNMGQKYNVKIRNSLFEDVAKFGYLERTLRNQDCVH